MNFKIKIKLFILNILEHFCKLQKGRKRLYFATSAILEVFYILNLNCESLYHFIFVFESHFPNKIIAFVAYKIKSHRNMNSIGIVNIVYTSVCLQYICMYICRYIRSVSAHKLTQLSSHCL